MSIPYPKFASLKSAGTPFVSPQRAFAWAMRSLALAALAVAPCARALDIFHLDPAVHMRFSSGNYKDGNLKENPHYVLAGYDRSGCDNTHRLLA